MGLPPEEPKAGPWRVGVQTDLEVLRQRDEARIPSGEVSRSVHETWIAEEVLFLSEDEPWERADVIASGHRACRPRAATGAPGTRGRRDVDVTG